MTRDPVPGAVAVQVRGCHAGSVESTHDWVADEVPVALQYNGISHAVMLASPLDLEDFAYGFSLSEGLVDTPADVHGVDLQHTPEGLVLEIEITSRCLARLKDRRRTLAGRTGCGLCGTESLAQALPAMGQPVQAFRIQAAAVGRAMQALRGSQTLQAATGATHAAAWCTPEGDLALLREDVGRHNALDKLIGALARAGAPASTGFIAVTSRASFEMVQKAARAGVGLLAAISAPTALAVRSAEQAGLCLVGFARGDDWVAYSHTDHLSP
ncbi:formate dehydrogenase accessory sulfurtransferase FdhD [Ideonella sp. BN130291]|uniref:formate dehydrogenase accessory sulfurtransferase FdhD n=1 Tax=Ideonella sp. BN130291 TaxID=3112940 RepID=UPI002E256E89|nr:formate dehydrogenase accessory sulfurtransferase FdhD [Ideonella sp. BN130291]